MRALHGVRQAGRVTLHTLALVAQRGLAELWHCGVACREMEELTFFDTGPKPEWGVEKKPLGRPDFLRPGVCVLREGEAA